MATFKFSNGKCIKFKEICVLACLSVCLNFVLERVIVVAELYEDTLSQRIKSSSTDR